MRRKSLNEQTHREIERRDLLRRRALAEAAKHSVAAIARDLGVKRTTVYGYLNRRLP